MLAVHHFYLHRKLIRFVFSTAKIEWNVIYIVYWKALTNQSAEIIIFNYALFIFFFFANVWAHNFGVFTFSHVFALFAHILLLFLTTIRKAWSMCTCRRAINALTLSLYSIINGIFYWFFLVFFAHSEESKTRVILISNDTIFVYLFDIVYVHSFIHSFCHCVAIVSRRQRHHHHSTIYRLLIFIVHVHWTQNGAKLMEFGQNNCVCVCASVPSTFALNFIPLCVLF